MSARRSAFAWAGSLFLVVVALKILVILLDPSLRLFLGDSASYLYAAYDDDWLPADRSFVYPQLIEWAAATTSSLRGLLYWQTAAGVLTAMLLTYVLRCRLSLPRVLVFVAVCAFAVEPAQLFYERMVMAETFGLLAFTAFFAAASAYLARANILWLPVVVAFGLAAVSLRMNFLPVVIVISLGLPLVLLFDPARRRRWIMIASHLAVAGLCFWGAHGTYRSYVAETFHSVPGYIGRNGVMRIGLIAPLIKPEHFVRVGLPADFASHLAYDLSDPDTRPQQLWSPGGLVDAIRHAGVDVDRTCRKLSAYAIRSDPFGVVRLGLRTLGGYFDANIRNARLDKDLARQPSPYPAKLVAQLRERWHYDFSGTTERWTPVSRAFAIGSGWLVACLFLLLPLGVVSVVVYWRDARRTQYVLGFLFAAGLVATHVLFSNIVSFRYLHAMPFFVMVTGLPLAFAAWRRMAVSRPQPLPA